MKYLTIVIALFFFSGLNYKANAKSQFENLKPNLRIDFQKTPQKNGFTLKIEGFLFNNYHTYSILKNQNSEISPSVQLENTTNYQLKKIIESPPILLVDDYFGESLWVHEKGFYFEYTFETLKKNAPVKGHFQIQICNQSICSLPLKYSFNL